MWRIVLCIAALSVVSWASSPLSTSPFPVVGVKTGIDKNTGQPPPRLNINTLWARRGPQWDLYILALSELQALDERDELSYYALTVTIATRYTSDLQPEYVAAAQTLRQPYWDWAAEPTLPPAVNYAHVTVRGPRGLVEMANPLYTYRFQRPAVELGFGGALAEYTETIRCVSCEEPISNFTKANEQLWAVEEDLTSEVYDVFTRTETDGWRVSDFEDPHNLIHAEAACNGTFADINWAAFDPLFMLHHCNVDRLVAMWQAIHYDDALFPGTENSTGQYGTPVNTTISANSPLKPFFDETMAFHTSHSVANITTFGYTYPELPAWRMPLEARASHVRAHVNSLYGRGSNGLSQTRTWNKAGLPVSKNYYTAEIGVDRSEMPLPATVALLMGGQPVGHASMLAMPCEGRAKFSLPVRNILVGNHTLRDLPPARVIGVLQRDLAVEIRKIDGTYFPIAAAPSLHLEIQHMEYTPRANESAFPVFRKNARKWPVQLRQHHRHHPRQ
ncbi:hypothetical protein N0V88_005325 [Collariella sp. IMI 366227]|nr:hypothetical protein N0V88_005325 [Collariella sp. IMI 366227]